MFILTIRCFFSAILILALIAYATSNYGYQLETVALGAVSGLLLSGLLFFIERLFKKNALLSLNLIALGLLFGFVAAKAILLFFDALVGSDLIQISSQASSFISLCVYLSSAYLGIVFTKQSAEEINFSVPFIKFNAIQQKKKDILVDPLTLLDPRLIDLANSGLLDHQLLIPRYAIKELQIQSETGDDAAKFKAKKALEALRKLESTPNLELRYTNKNSPDIQDHHLKLVKIARQSDANILTADLSKIHQSEMEGLKVIDINFLSHVLKPTTTAGEHLQIKVLRYGKEPRQGVGYLDDGTMVVINGGAEFMGQTIKALVLSVKSTPAGRMIFCNTTEETDSNKDDEFAVLKHLESSAAHP